MAKKAPKLNKVSPKMAKIIHNWSQLRQKRETWSKSYCQPKILLATRLLGFTTFSWSALWKGTHRLLRQNIYFHSPALWWMYCMKYKVSNKIWKTDILLKPDDLEYWIATQIPGSEVEGSHRSQVLKEGKIMVTLNIVTEN